MPTKRSHRPTKSSTRKDTVVPPMPDVTELLEESSSSSTAAAVATAPSEDKSESSSFSPPDASALATSRRRRTRLTSHELELEFDAVMKSVSNELQATRTCRGRDVSVQTWRKLINDIKRLKAQSLRSTSKKERKQSNTHSGFEKPVRISNEMAKFTGWDPSELRSRVDVTNYICNYIRENDLQNPEDRRQILADKKLSSLLRYSKDTDGVPLTYFYMQKKIQPHFPK